MIDILASHVSIVNQLLHEIRDENIQSDRLRLTTNLELIGEICAYEISKQLNYCDTHARTKFGIADTRVLAAQPVVATVLRAGLPFYNGIIRVINQADSAFIAANRLQERKSGPTKAEAFYLGSPDIAKRDLILTDTMLATGETLTRSFGLLMQIGQPKRVFVSAVIASTQGIKKIQQDIPKARIIVGAVDDYLNSEAYIVPGLGDAGDLLYGQKYKLNL